MGPENDYVPRPEYEAFCQANNGCMTRLETGQHEMNGKLDVMISTLNERVTWTAFDKYKEGNEEAHKEFRGRPSWPVTVIFTTMLTVISVLVSLAAAGVFR